MYVCFSAGWLSVLVVSLFFLARILDYANAVDFVMYMYIIILYSVVANTVHVPIIQLRSSLTDER